MEIVVESPVGQVCGYVQQGCACADAKFSVLDAQQQAVLSIDGPRGCCEGCSNYPLKEGEYTIMTSDGAQEVGKLTKHWMGYGFESLTTKDKFVVAFPLDLDVRMKAVLIGAVFIIDYMYFEHKRYDSYLTIE